MASIRRRRWTSAKGKRVAWVVDYLDQLGKRRHRTFERKDQAEAFMVEAKHEIRQGLHAVHRESPRLADVAAQWLAAKRAEGLEEHTLRSYESASRLHLVPRIGSLKLSQITRPVVEGLKDELMGERSPATARSTVQQLRTILGFAQGRGLVAFNAAIGVTVRQRGRLKKQLEVGCDVPSREQVRALLESVGDKWRPILVTAVFTGMRSSELRGLAWDAVDFDKKTITVRQRANEKGIIGAPKSATSRRSIPMVPILSNTLRAWREQCPKSKSNLVFPRGSGRPIEHAVLHRSLLRPLQTELGMIDEQGRHLFGMHSFRHFYASWLIDEAFSPKQVQSLLGHSSITITFDTYGHLFSTGDLGLKLAESAELLVPSATIAQHETQGYVSTIG